MQHSLAGRRILALLVSVAAVFCSHPAAALNLSLGLGRIEAATAPAFDGEFDQALPPLQLTEAALLEERLVTERVASGALEMLGTRYKWGSKGGATVDCSSLVQRAYRAAGLEIPRTTREQVGLGRPVALTQLRKGDLVFYRWQRRGLHVAVYMDDGYIVHASPGKGRVVMTRLNPAWQRRMVAARRLF